MRVYLCKNGGVSTVVRGGGGCCCVMGCWVGVSEPDAEWAIGICDGFGVCGLGVVLVGPVCTIELDDAIGCARVVLGRDN